MNVALSEPENSAAPPKDLDLLLIRLLVLGKKSPGPKKIRDDLGRLMDNPPSSETFQTWIDQIRSDGLINKKGMSLTEIGRQRALDILGVSELPPRLNWQSLQSRILLPLALGWKPDSEQARRLAGAKSPAALLLKHRFGLQSSANTMNEVLAALTCRGLGIPEEKSLKDIQATIVGRLFGERLPAERLIDQAPRILLGARTNSKKGLSEAVLQSWLRAESPVADSNAPTGSRQKTAIVDPEVFDMAAFAHTVLAAARDITTGRFGDNKVFINHVWRRLAGERAFADMDLPRFKERLIEANRADLLTLSRADLANLLDPKDIADSETTYQTEYVNGVFHFILIEKERT